MSSGFTSSPFKSGGPRKSVIRGWIEAASRNCQLDALREDEVARDGDLVAWSCGAPSFQDDDIARLASERGATQAWLALYRRVGASAADHVVGRFAVVVFEPQAARAFAAVDRFAIETLCYCTSRERFAFADRADSVPGSSGRIDEQALFDYLYSHVIASPRTVLRGVSRLPPAHRLVFDNGRCSVEPYWQPVFEEHSDESFESLRETFRTALSDAVAAVAKGSSFGCYLSGGLDSTTVAGMVGKVTGRPARTYSIGFDVAGYDEMRYARIAARHFGCDHHEYYVSPKDLLEHLPRLAQQFDQPFGNSSALPAHCCALMARNDGVTTMLAGDGGDELFGGNARYAKQKLFEAYSGVPSVFRSLLLEPTARSRVSRLPLLRKVASYVEQASAPLPDRLEMYNLLTRLGIAEIFTPEFLARVDTGASLAARRQVFASVRASSATNRMLGYDWKYVLAENDLRKVLGSASLANVKVEFPLLDQRLVDFSLRLRPSLKVRGFTLRWFFKKALEDFLPPETIAKKKHGFGLPFGAWALSHADLRAFATDALVSLKARGIVRPAFIDELIDRRLAEHPNYYGEMVWILMMLELWLRGHEAATTATPPAGDAHGVRERLTLEPRG